MNIWIARDDNGSLYLYKNKPVKVHGTGEFIDEKDEESFLKHIPSDLYPEVKYENSPKKLIVEED